MRIKKYALISVFDKTNLSIICNILNKYNIGIISTGSTSNQIKQIGYKSISISSLTKFKEILDGRVKTLHPKIHASLLFDRNNESHKQIFTDLKFPVIDFVFVNLYPFEKITNSSKDIKKIINMIDIGGPALLRSSAKNFNSITTISNINDYKMFSKNLKLNNGQTSLKFRKLMAKKTFKLTSNYDRLIANWFDNKEIKNPSEKIKKIPLKYGENPNQKSFFVINKENQSFFNYKIQGKEMGYNNLLDLDSGFNLINEFTEPTCVIIKHNNPCGVASNKSIYIAFKKALESDPVSSFGGIVLFNRTVNKYLASILENYFFEIIAAKRFDNTSRSILAKKQKLILIKTYGLTNDTKEDIKSINAGYLLQDKNNLKINNKSLKCVSKKRASIKIINDLVFASKICKHVKSNAIVLARNKQTIGIGAGQMSRIDATKLAIKKILLENKKKNFVAASDAFFPFTDNVKKLIKNNCKAIVQPSGSINDKKIVSYVDKNNVSLYFIKYRMFKH